MSTQRTQLAQLVLQELEGGGLPADGMALVWRTGVLVRVRARPDDRTWARTWADIASLPPGKVVLELV